MKKRKTTITPELRRAIWDLYIGPGVAYAKCPLCGITELSRSESKGFEAAHIVADAFMIDTKLNSLYLFPSCSACNGECRTFCLLDYLWLRERYDVLSNMMWAIFSHYVRQRPSEKHSQAWKVLNHLYGPERFPAGGGLINQTPIFKLCTSLQMEHLMQECALLSDEITQRQKVVKNLMTVMYPDEKAQFV